MREPLTSITRIARRASGTRAAARTLPEETPVALSYAGTTHAVMMASPADLEDFAVGFSLTEGVIASPGEIETIDGRCERITRILRNDNGLLVEDVAISDRLRGVYFGDVGWADYDSDGDLDLAVAGWDEFGQESARLYENDGETPDRLLTLTSGLGEQPELKGVRYADLSWADMDNDGDLDLVVCGFFGEISIFLNPGNASFLPRTDYPALGD